MLMDKKQKNILFYCTLFLVILTITCSFVCRSMANINLEMRNNNIVDSSLVVTDTAACINIINKNIDSIPEIKGKVIYAKVTCYQPVKSQCGSNPLVTADGSRIHLGKLKRGEIKWCAVSRDISRMFPKGCKKKMIHIEGHGIYEVKDATSARLTKTVDLLIHPSHKPFYKRNIKITLLIC